MLEAEKSDLVTAIAATARFISVRLEPGADLHDGLARELARLELPGGALVSAAGSLASVSFARAGFDSAGNVVYVEPRHETGAIEIVSLGGHVGQDADGNVRWHVHGAFALTDGTIVGGHVFDASVLATVELTLLTSDATRWVAQRAEGFEGFEAWVLTPEVEKEGRDGARRIPRDR